MSKESQSFSEEFTKLLETDYHMSGYGLSELETMLNAYRELMEKREPYATKVLDAIDMVNDSIEI